MPPKRSPSKDSSGKKSPKEGGTAAKSSPALANAPAAPKAPARPAAARAKGRPKNDRTNRRADPVKEEVQKENVLLAAQDLAEAASKATSGGKKRLGGLYLPNGQKMEANAADEKIAETKADKMGNEEAQQNMHISHISRTYDKMEKRKVKNAERVGKTPEDIDNEKVDEIAKRILAGTNQAEHMEFQELFDFFDFDKDRTWGTIEFAQRMTDIGYKTTIEDASNLLYFAGVKDVDCITYNDFLLLMPKLKAFRQIIERDAMRVFGSYDHDGDGWLKEKKVREVFRDLAGPEGIDDDTLNDLIKRADRLKTGRIPYDFFITALMGTKPTIAYENPRARSNPIIRLLSKICCGSTLEEDFAAARADAIAAAAVGGDGEDDSSDEDVEPQAKKGDKKKKK